MTPRPLPRLASWLLTRHVPAEWRDSIAGDLAEERKRRIDAGRRAGAWWACAAAIRVSVRLRAGRRATNVRITPRHRRFLMDGIAADLRHAVRGLVKNRGYASMAVVTLALGIGANAAVFNLANWLLLRPLPGVQAQGRLVTLTFTAPGGQAFAPIAVADLEALRRGVAAFEGLAGYQSFALHIAPAGGQPRRVDADVVSGAYFDVLRGAIASGRGFSIDEGQDPAAAPAAIVSHQYWLSDLGADPSVIGRSIAINGHPFTVIGVTVRGFRGTTLGGATDVWVPIAQHRYVLPQYPSTALTNRKSTILFGLVGRLAPGATAATAAAQIDAVRAQIVAANPTDSRMQKWRFDVRAGVESRPWIRDRLGRAVGLLMGVVGLLLLLTCANVANLMVARSAERRGEIATRLALGASRARVARLLMTESLLLSLAAGAVAVALAYVAGRALEGTVILQGMPPLDRAEIDWRVMTFALGASIVMAVAVGVSPALTGSRFDVNATLRQAGRSHTSGRRRIRQVLTMAQVAISVTLLVGAALLLRSMAARLNVDPGFDPAKVLSFSVEPGLQGFDRARQATFYRDTLDRVRRAPGVRSAGLAWLRPYSQGLADTGFRPEGQPAHEAISADLNAISPGFFDAIGLALVEGRDFTEREFLRREANDNGVVILTDGLARKTFGDAPAVGRRIAMDDKPVIYRTVVGVVRDTRQRRLTDSADMLFEPFGQSIESGWASVLVGLGGSEDTVTQAIRQAVRDVDSTLPVYDVIRLDRAIRRQFADDALVMRLTMVFAALATLLAGVGLYGVLARGVSERRREFSIRTALGAAPASIGALVASEALRVAAAGVAAGLVATYWLTGFLTSRLFGVARLDPAAFAAAITLVLAISLGSALGPARRAARIDPAKELR